MHNLHKRKRTDFFCDLALTKKRAIDFQQTATSPFLYCGPNLTLMDTRSTLKKQ